MRAPILVCLLLGIVGCSSDAKPWPDRPLVKKTAEIGPHTVTLMLPKGVGVYNDPNGKIWRSVSPDYAFFVKVFKSDHPADLAAALNSISLDPGQKVVSKKASAGSYEIIVEEPGNHRHTVHVWKAKGAAAVSCLGLLGENIGDKAMVQKSSRWILAMCRSIELQ